MSELNLANLPKFDVLATPTYDEILAANLAILKTYSPDYKPLEGDDRMLLLEAFSYRELFLRKEFNAKLKSLTVLFAVGDELDVIAINYGIERLKNEDDGVFRQRIIDSLHRFSTAGSIESYLYHARSVDAIIDDVYAYSPEAGKVEVILASYSSDISQDLINKVVLKLNATKVRPLTDEVSVLQAEKVNIEIDAEIEVYNLDEKTVIEQKIKDVFKKFKIARGLTNSQIITMLSIDGVYRIKLNEPKNDTNVTKRQIINITAFNLVFKKAEDE